MRKLKNNNQLVGIYRWTVQKQFVFLLWERGILLKSLPTTQICQGVSYAYYRSQQA